MAIIFNRYLNGIDYTRYDSSNIVYSECYDNEGLLKNVKIVFKGGRTYLYKDVNADDYIQFKLSPESHGSAVHEHIIKKYQCVRLPDVDVEQLNNFKNETIEEDIKIEESTISNVVYNISINDETGEFTLTLNGRPLYRGVEGKVSIINLLKCLNIKYTISNNINENEEE